jgi:hypothetical protein
VFDELTTAVASGGLDRQLLYKREACCRCCTSGDLAAAVPTIPLPPPRTDLIIQYLHLVQRPNHSFKAVSASIL